MNSIAAGDQSEYAAAVLVRLSARAGQHGGDVGGLQRYDAGRPQVGRRPMSTSGCPGEASARVYQQAGLDGSEGHGDVSGNGGTVHLAGVSVDTARQIDGDDESTVTAGLRDQFCQRRPGLAQAAVASDAGKAVNDQVRGRDGLAGRGRDGLASIGGQGGIGGLPGHWRNRPGAAGVGLRGWHQPASAGRQLSRTRFVQAGSGRHRYHGRAPGGQAGRRVQRVAAVVAPAGQHDDAGAIDLARRPAQTAASPAAARCISVPSGRVAISACSASRTAATVSRSSWFAVTT